MGVFKKIKARAKGSRGGDAPDFVLKQFEESWDDWEETIKGLDAETKNEMIAAFNQIADGLGEALCEDKGSFKMTLADLNAEELKQFTGKLSPEYFEITPDPEAKE